MTRWISAVAIGMVGLMCSAASAEISLSVSDKTTTYSSVAQEIWLDVVFKNNDASFPSLELQAYDAFLKIAPQAGAKGTVSIVEARNSSDFNGTVVFNPSFTPGVYNIGCISNAAIGTATRYGTAAGLAQSGIVFQVKLGVSPGATGAFKINFDTDAENGLGLVAPTRSMLPSPEFKDGTLTINQVPEPATWAMLTSGLVVGGLGLWRRRRSK